MDGQNYAMVGCMDIYTFTLETTPGSKPYKHADVSIGAGWCRLTRGSKRRPKTWSLRSRRFGFPRCARPRLSQHVRLCEPCIGASRPWGLSSCKQVGSFRSLSALTLRLPHFSPIRRGTLFRSFTPRENCSASVSFG